jgi:hypothetical protein
VATAARRRDESEERGRHDAHRSRARHLGTSCVAHL